MIRSADRETSELSFRFSFALDSELVKLELFFRYRRVFLRTLPIWTVVASVRVLGMSVWYGTLVPFHTTEVVTALRVKFPYLIEHDIGYVTDDSSQIEDPS